VEGTPLVVSGILLAIMTGIVSAFVNGTFFSNVDFGHLLGLPLPRGFHLSTSFLFELSICLSVLGSVTHMLNALGRPSERDIDSNICLQKISEDEEQME
jgi:xanthine/uracil permease